MTDGLLPAVVRGMRRRAALGAVLAALAVPSGCAKPEVLLADGGGASWAGWHGKWLVINYWAEWCAPCRVEIPELNRLHHEGAEAGVVVLGVNFDGVLGESLDALIQDLGIEFPVLLDDPGARWDLSRPSILPSTLVIGPDGALAGVLIGPQTYESLAEAVGLAGEA
jgi:thiol-disulfide isomerase/thioredoxin